MDIPAGYLCCLAAAWTAPSLSTVRLAAKLCGYHLPEASLTKSSRAYVLEITITHFPTVIHCRCRLRLSYRRSLSHYRRRSRRYHHSRPKKNAFRPIFLSCYPVLPDQCMQGPLNSQKSFALNGNLEDLKEQVESKEPVTGRRNREKTKRSKSGGKA